MEIIRYVSKRDVEKLILRDISISKFIANSLRKEEKAHYGYSDDLKRDIPITITIKEE